MIYTVIANHLSGNYNEDIINKFILKLKTQQDIVVKLIKIDSIYFLTDFIAWLKKGEKHCLIFACGDGTINFAINEIVKRDDIENFTITVIPMGTANVFAKELNIKDYNDTIKSIINNYSIKMNLCSIEKLKNYKKTVFFLMASIGYDSMAVYNLNDNLKKKLGKLAYIISFIKTIFLIKKINLKLEIEGKKYKCCNVIVQNCKYYGGKFRIANTELEREELEVLIIKEINIISILSYLLFKKSNNIDVVKCKNLTISSTNSNQEIFSEIDGDLSYDIPVKISIIDKKIKVLKN